MTDSSKAVGIVVALTVAGLMAAFLMPVVIGQFDGQATSTYTQNTGETVTLQPELNATLDSTDTTNGSATYTINASGSLSTVSVSNGTSTTVTVGGTDVTIAPTDINTGSATTDYTYDSTYGWSGGAAALWTIIPVLIVLAVFLFFVGTAINRTGVGR